MSFRIASNVGSLTAQHSLFNSTRSMNRSLEKLSTGFKINRGADGPAALVISEKQRAQIAGLEKAIENTEKAGSVMQTAEGALNEINSLLVKVRSLALDSANAGVNDQDAMDANQAEIANALQTIDRIANNTQFSTKKLLNGEAGVLGEAADADVSFLRATADTQENTYAISVSTVGERAYVSGTTANTTTSTADETLTINGTAIVLASGSTMDDMVDRVNSFTAETGVIAYNDSGTLQLKSENFGSDESIVAISDTAAGASNSGIGTVALTDDGEDIQVDITPAGGTTTTITGDGNIIDVDTGPAKGLMLQFGAQADANAYQTVTGGQGNVTIENNSLVFQIGANKDQTAEIAIAKMTADSLGLASNNTFANLGEISVDSDSNAQEALEVIDAAITEVTNIRGDLGAFQANTLESTANNLRGTLENTVYAESVIRNTDFASELAEFTKNQVLVQAGTSLLSSANQTSQLVLSLL